MTISISVCFKNVQVFLWLLPFIHSFSPCLFLLYLLFSSPYLCDLNVLFSKRRFIPDASLEYMMRIEEKNGSVEMLRMLFSWMKPVLSTRTHTRTPKLTQTLNTRNPIQQTETKQEFHFMFMWIRFDYFFFHSFRFSLIAITLSIVRNFLQSSI